MGKNDETRRGEIYIDALATCRTPISPNSYFAYTLLRRLGIRKKDDLEMCSSNGAMFHSNDRNDLATVHCCFFQQRAILFLFRKKKKQKVKSKI